MGKHGPCAVIQAPLILIKPNPLRLDDLRDLSCHVGGPQRRIVERREFLGKPVEVVDRSRTRHRGHGSRTEVPMRRYDEQCAWTRQDLAKPAPGVGKAVPLQRVHRAAMSDEQRGHPTGMDGADWQIRHGSYLSLDRVRQGVQPAGHALPKGPVLDLTAATTATGCPAGASDSRLDGAVKLMM